MKSSQFEAKTFGVGELIAQRKLFRVPLHQRSYAWDKESVEEFLTDIEVAHSSDVSDYFIGLIVIQASPSGEWVLLDGQQRLTTVSLIYAAVRHWLSNQGFSADAQQIHHEYLGVRRLGGEFSSRMLLNHENQAIFEIAATETISDAELKRRAADTPRSASNKLILNAAIACRKWIADFADDENASGRVDVASKIYDLARFLDSRLKVVAVEVSSDVDAYVLFESLNDRGVALSALDLVKNFIFSKAPGEAANWDDLLKTLGDENPEDFLKVFWTSRYGLAQKSQIFRWVKSRYESCEDAVRLLTELRQDALILAALGDDDHPFWERFDSSIRDQVFLLRSLDSKQARPLLIALLRDANDDKFISKAINLVTVAIVRFQVIGKGRTGVVEKVFGRLCQSISSDSALDVAKFREGIAELITGDVEFQEAFRRHQDKKYSRIAYFLAADCAAEEDLDLPVSASAVRRYFDQSRAVRLVVPGNAGAMDLLDRIGNYVLLVTRSSSDIDLPKPDLDLERMPADAFIEKRSEQIAARAVKIWSAGVDR